MFKNIVFIILSSLAFTFRTYAQIGIGTTSPNADALMELSSSDKGLLIPRLALTNSTNPSPLSTHVVGMTIYNTATTGDVIPGIYYNNGSAWISVNSNVSGNTQDVLSAEYSGAVLDSTGTNGANVGCLRSENTGAANNFRNTYVWESSEATLQSYNIVVRYTVPEEFLAIQTNWLSIDYKMGAASGNNLTFSVVKDDNTPVLNTTTPSNSTSWATETIGTNPLNPLAAGDVLIITMTLSANNTASAAMSVGDISFNYSK